MRNETPPTHPQKSPIRYYGGMPCRCLSGLDLHTKTHGDGVSPSLPIPKSPSRATSRDSPIRISVERMCQGVERPLLPAQGGQAGLELGADDW